MVACAIFLKVYVTRVANKAIAEKKLTTGIVSFPVK